MGRNVNALVACPQCQGRGLVPYEKSGHGVCWYCWGHKVVLAEPNGTMKAERVLVTPVSRWLQEKVDQHGNVFSIRGRRGSRVLLESINKTKPTPNGPEKWLGWIDDSDAVIEPLS